MHVGTHPTRHLATLSNLLLFLTSPEYGEAGPSFVADLLASLQGSDYILIALECDFWRIVSEDSRLDIRDVFPFLAVGTFDTISFVSLFVCVCCLI